ncbi:hypothetical protein C0061_16995, partial [Bordetella pertussis]
MAAGWRCGPVAHSYPSRHCPVACHANLAACPGVRPAPGPDPASAACRLLRCRANAIPRPRRGARGRR